MIREAAAASISELTGHDEEYQVSVVTLLIEIQAEL